jgi:hypothetical protein
MIKKNEKKKKRERKEEKKMEKGENEHIYTIHTHILI